MTDPIAEDARKRCGTLTERQRDCLVLTCKGLMCKEIAALLNVSPTTVETHLAHTRKKFDVTTTVEAAVVAAKAGIV